MMGMAHAAATNRTTDCAAAMDTDAIINVRYTTTSVSGGAAELLVYGTQPANKSPDDEPQTPPRRLRRLSVRKV
jgi:uncharacterized protein YbjQ (UPF0145 family)